MFRYKEFNEEFNKQMQCYFGEDTIFKKVYKVKANGSCIEYLVIIKNDKQVFPAIYLPDFYEVYRLGFLSLEELVKSIIKENPRKDTLNAMWIGDFQSIKSKICFLLLNEEEAKFLKNVPLVSINDMAMVFYILVEKEMDEIWIQGIETSDLDRWDINIEELLKLAVINTKKLHPAKFKREGTYASYHKAATGTDVPMYVLSNESGIFGAACILYEDAIEEFANEKESDLIIIPISIHKALIFLEKGEDFVFQYVEKLVSTNLFEKSVTGLLSNCAIHYKRKKAI